MTKYYEFADMHSGGGAKTDYEYIYIKAESEEEAVEIFEAKFDRSPYHTTCDCCGPDYSIWEVEKPTRSASDEVLIIEKDV